MAKKSFFEKLTSNIRFTSDDDAEVQEEYTEDNEYYDDVEEVYEEQEEDIEIGELSIDMYRIKDAIILKTMVAGIQKSEINITLTRDRVRIEGSRQSDPLGQVQEHYHQELYWGVFERDVALPEEVDIELAEAHESHGLLTLVLPLVDRNRQARLTIK